MADANIPKFVFYRTNEVLEHGDFKGNRGILQVNGTLYFTVEREIPRYVYIPLGTYTLKMESSPTKKRDDDAPRQQFRIMGHNVPTKRGGLANLLIHDGNYPGELEGCIAPGKSQIPGGVGQSRIAMDELFNACGGGFQPKDDAAILEVVSKPIIQDPTGTYPTF